eukprot:symbB.v1.2.027259.t1/scaffold2785.1/size70456/2
MIQPAAWWASGAEGLTYRASYVLVGVKDGVALGEQTFEDGGQNAQVTATYSLTQSNTIKVNSTSRSAGNEVIFQVDGNVLSVTTGRGMNVAILRPGGFLDSFQVFDTHAEGSEALVVFIESLSTGSLVACGARDDAMGNLSFQAKEALKTCGATLIDSISYRGSYALIGIKNGPALAEQAFPDGQHAVAIAEYSAEVSVSDESPTTTTTSTTTTDSTTSGSCAMFTCPSGYVIKTDQMWTLQSQNETVCCVAAEEDMANVGVRSAGFADGNEAVFFANGVEFYRAPSRGLTLVTVRSDGTRKDSATFDTMLDEGGSGELVSYVNSIEDGTMVLVGARDEASIHLSQAAKDAIKTLGATQIDSISFRAGYGLVGVKGGSAVAEDVKKTLEGPAVAVGQMKIIISIDANKPVCDVSLPTPPVSGYVSQGNLNLDAGCRYNLYEASHATGCLQGSWIMMTGSSNTLLEFGNLINFLAPEEYNIQRDGEMIGASAVADVVIENGQVTHWATISNQLQECRQVDASLALQNRPACKQAIENLLAQAPAYSTSAIRITMFISFFWYRTELALETVNADVLWQAANVAVVTQVGAWYNVCSVTKEDYCPRQELLEMERDPAIQVFKDEMEVVLTKMETFCTGSGRASQLGCYVQTISWTNGVRDNENFQIMNGYIEEAMSSRLSSSFRLVDFFRLGGAMPEEVVNGHGSQMLNLWVWTVMFNAMCPADLAASGSYALWQGNLCSGTEARFENCPNYYPSCLEGPRCEKWECMNSVPCTLKASDPPIAGNTEGLCADALNISSFLAEATDTEAMASDACHNSQGLRVRLWCNASMEFVLPLVAFLAAVALKGVLYFNERMAATKADAKKGDAKESKGKELAQEAAPGLRPLALFGSERPQKLAASGANMTCPSGPGSPACSDDHSDLDFSLEINEDMKTTTAKTQRSTKTEKSVAQERSKAKSVAQSEVQPGASRAASQVEDFNDVLDPAPAVLARSKSHVTLKSEAATAKSEAKSEVKSEANHVEIPEPVKAPVAQVEDNNDVKEPVKQITIRVAGNKYPLGLARFMGSTHVVLGHLFAKGVTEPIYFFGWGFTWVPWFFMLSGFVLFSAYLKNPKEETMVQYVMRRSTTIYPLYAFSLIPAFMIGKAAGTMAAEWPTLLAQSFLLQAWVPHFTENALQMHCWFLSCMVVYWFFFKPLSHCLKSITLLKLGLHVKTCLLMAFLFFLPWLLIFIPLFANEDVDWYKEHSFYATDTFLDIGVVMLKFHPICYFHVFILGMLLAKLRQLLDQKAKISQHGCFSWRNPYNVALQFVAPLGYLALFLVFSVQEFQAKSWGYKLSARISVLLPFQAMILFGLAGLPSLPLPMFSYAFSKMDFLENYSYCVYVFQFLCYAVWPQTGLVNLALFLVWTYASAYLLAKCVQQPIQRWWASHTKGRLVVPFVLAAALVGCSFLPDPAYDGSLPDIPERVVVDNHTVDVRLQLRDPEGHRLGASIINPSVLIQDDRVVVVARRHRRETLQRNAVYDGPEGSGDAVVIDQIWHSEIIIGSTSVDSMAWSQWPNGGDSSPLDMLSMSTWSGLRTAAGKVWKDDLCWTETWIPSNNTLIRHVVTGPEDPKMVDQAGTLIMAYDSKPPHGGDTSICRKNSQGFTDAVTQMYLSSGVQPQDVTTPMMGYRLSYGQSDVAEKNWIPFTYKNSLYFVYTPMPHVILSAQMDGSSEKVYSTTFRPLQRIAQESPHVQIRGSAQAVLVNNTAATPSLPREHYLALLHLHDSRTGKYAHYAYRFGAEPPFMMLQMSSQLPLTEAAAMPNGVQFAFASGLAVKGNTVIITYGAGDRDARALVMTLEKLDDLFQCSTYQE